jgi:hypothetical protein
MNICKADAIAQLSKWYRAGIKVRAMYRSVTGHTLIIGTMTELSPSTVKIAGDGCEIILYFRDTSEYEYNDAREPLMEGHQTNRYPIFIDVKFGNGDHLQMSEFSTNSGSLSP